MERRAIMDKYYHGLSVSAQFRLLGINLLWFYFIRKGESQLNINPNVIDQ